MEKQSTSRESAPKKSSEERIKNLKKGDQVAKLVEIILLMYEGVEGKKLGSEEFNKFRGEINEFMGSLAREVQNIQSEREKNNS